MAIDVNFGTDNACFDDGNGPAEAARILRLLADKIEAGSEGGLLYDENGNRIGEWSAEYTAPNADGLDDEARLEAEADAYCPECNNVGCTCFDPEGQ